MDGEVEKALNGWRSQDGPNRVKMARIEKAVDEESRKPWTVDGGVEKIRMEVNGEVTKEEGLVERQRKSKGEMDKENTSHGHMGIFPLFCRNFVWEF